MILLLTFAFHHWQFHRVCHSLEPRPEVNKAPLVSVTHPYPHKTSWLPPQMASKKKKKSNNASGYLRSGACDREWGFKLNRYNRERRWFFIFTEDDELHIVRMSLSRSAWIPGQRLSPVDPVVTTVLSFPWGTGESVANANYYPHRSGFCSRNVHCLSVEQSCCW